MNYLSVMISILILMLPLASRADEATPHPIDKIHQSCVKKDSTTIGMTNCTYEAYDMWDKELNKNYNELMNQLRPQGKQVLKAAQREWLEYRDKEFNLIDQIYSQLEGTMYIPMRVDDRLQIVKQRALLLKKYADSLKFQNN
jgi:uncharacterized protein YecT (DUF1311 family)